MRAMLLAIYNALDSIVNILTPVNPEPQTSVAGQRTRKTSK